MTKTFTHDDLIRYVYDETTEEENRQLENAMACDTDLLDKYNELMWLKAQMEGSMKAPSEKTTKTIIEYSKAVNLHSIKE